MSKIIKIHPDNPHIRAIEQVVDVLKNGGIIVYPSDTVYSLGCDVNNIKAMEKLANLKNVKLEKSFFSLICNDLSHLSSFSKPIDNTTFRFLKNLIPGPFTFILNASKNLPNSYKNKKTIGIRVPDHKIPQMIIEKLGNPISSTSIHNDDEILDYITDPELIKDKFGGKVDLIIDSGYGGNTVSTIIDLTDSEPNIIRQGKGMLHNFIVN